MAIDTTPSTVATNALQAIPFAALIGGPLDACIKAQAAAAKTSWEFINEVGLTIDKASGEKKAINVTFQYNNNGQMSTLVVPLLVIVPIPYLAINTVSIDFLANISAASSSASETSSDTDLGVDVSAEASLSVGPFSLTVKANANYSSKQHSKASQNSSYSVEYTMGVHVEGGQADMPAGLTTILNILQGSITSVGADDCLTLTPANLSFNKTQTASLQVVIKNTQGVLAPGVTVSYKIVGDSPFENITMIRGFSHRALLKDIADGKPLNRVSRPFLNRYAGDIKYQLNAYKGDELLTQSFLPATINDINGNTAVTDKNGAVTFMFKLSDKVYYGTQMLQGKISVSADVPVVSGKDDKTTPEEQDIVYSIIPLGPNKNFNPSVNQVNFTPTDQTEAINITITDGTGNPVTDPTDVTVTVTMASGTADDVFTAITVSPTAGTPAPTPDTANGLTSNGSIQFTFALKSGLTNTDVSGNISITAQGANSNVIPITVKIP